MQRLWTWWALLGLVSGCADILGYRDVEYLETGGGGAGGVGGMGGGGATGGQGGMGGTTGPVVCEPGAEESCYDGPPGTENVSTCKAGTHICNQNGTGYDACKGAVLPSTETCADTADENCDQWDCVLWANGYGDANIQTPTDIAVDGAGNVFVAGNFQGTVDFGGNPLVSSGASDLFLVKLDPGGKHVWSKKFGDAQDQTSISVAADAAGNVIIAGTFTGTLQIGDQMLVNSGPTDMFMAKLDAAGNKLWARQYGNDSDLSRTDITIDSNGDIIAVGSFKEMLSLGGPTLDSTVADVFHAKFDGVTGIVSWSYQSGAEHPKVPYTVAVDANGNVAVGGLTFGNGTTVPPARLITRLDPNGIATWERQIPDGIALLSTEFNVAVALDPSGSVFVASTFNEPINAGRADLAPVGGRDVFLVKYDSAGTHLWSHGYGTPENEDHPRLAIDSEGNILLAVTSHGQMDFGGGALPNKDDSDVAVAKLDPAGNHLWSRSFGGAATQHLPVIAAAASGESVIACEFGGSIDFGTGPILSNNTDVAIAKLAR